MLECAETIENALVEVRTEVKSIDSGFRSHMDGANSK